MGADVAAFKQAARAEIAAASGATFAQSLIDLAKCFEVIPRDLLVREAQALGYCLYTLRASLATYAMRRTLSVAGVCSRLLRAERGITAGSAHATCELRLLIMRSIDRVAKMCTTVSMTIFVDDTAIEATGTPTTVSRDLAQVTAATCEAFQQLRLDLSPTRNKILAFVESVATNVVSKLSLFGFTAAKTAKSLGVGMGAGVRRNMQVLKARLGKFTAKTKRIRTLMKAGADAARLVRTGGISSFMYGVASTGVSDSFLHKQRRAAAAATTNSIHGKNVDMLLVSADAASGRASTDPAVKAHTDVIGMWAEMAWGKWLPRKSMNIAIADATRRLAVAKRPWAVVRGPAAALVATCARLRWTVADAYTIHTDDGYTLVLDRDSPEAVRRAVRDAVKRWRWRRIETDVPALDSAGAGRGACFKPIRKLLTRCAPAKGWTRGAQAAMKSSLVHVHWT